MNIQTDMGKKAGDINEIYISLLVAYLSLSLHEEKHGLVFNNLETP